jgi:hypothetical protein
MNIQFSWKIYLMLFLVITISFIGAWTLPVKDAFKGISTLPGIGALLAIIYQILRDQINFEREKEIQRKEHFFNLSVTSHMANIAFDKHVQFCEKYIKQMHEGLIKLSQDGPTQEALSIAVELSKIKKEFRTWLTKDIMDSVKQYEEALLDIGSKARSEEHIKDDKKRAEVIDEMFRVFSGVRGIKATEGKIDEKITPEKIIHSLQQVLGIQELTKLRQKVITEAIKSIS